MLSLYGVDMRKDEIDSLLRKAVKGRAGFDNISEQGVIFLNLSLLVR